jgi:hypothetical protein
MCITNRSVPGVDELDDFVVKMVNQFVSQNKSFTIYDVTKQLRDENPTVEFAHNDIRDIVNQMFKRDQITGYLKQLAQLKTGQSAFVYFNINDDVTSHPAVGGDISVVDPTVLVPAQTDDEEMIEITKESRLNIPQNLLHSLGMNAGDDVYLQFNDLTDSMVLAKKGTTDSVGFKVNADGAVRIAQSRLVKNLNASQFYNVCIENTVIDGNNEDVISIKSTN